MQPSPISSKNLKINANKHRKCFGGLLILFLFFQAFSSYSQSQADSLNVPVQEASIDPEVKLEEATHLLDTLILDKVSHIDSIQTKTDEVIDKTQELNDKLAQVGDTLNPDLSKYNGKLDSIKNRLTLRIDSLNKIGQPSEKYTRLLDSLEQIGPVKKLNEVKGKVAGAQNKVNGIGEKLNSPADKIEGKVNEKLNLMKSEGGEGANLPGNVNLPGVDAPGLPGIDATLPSTDLNLPAANPGLENPVGNTDLNGIPDVKGGLGGIDELNKVQGDLGEIKEVTGQVSGYGEDVKSITSGNMGEVKELPKTMEAEAVKRMDAGELQGQTQVVDDYKDKLAMGNDPDAMKEEALKQAPKLAKNHFKGQEAVLQQAMDKVNSYKNKYTELTNLEDIPKIKPNEMKGKPLRERIVPGLTLQIQRAANIWVDYNPYLGYKISGRLMAGLGWNERIGITSKMGVAPIDRIYGPRTFLDFKIKKGFTLKAEVEKMNAFIPPGPFSGVDIGAHQWMWSVFVGMKKEYEFMKGVNGNFQFLYNLYDDHDNSPYTGRINVRFGFEFPQMKKDKKKTKE